MKAFLCGQSEQEKHLLQINLNFAAVFFVWNIVQDAWLLLLLVCNSMQFN